MAGGLLQLVAYGAQDLYLTGNPQITFFKVVYRRHTNFAIESKKLQFNGTPNFGSSSVCNIITGPDLLHKLYLEIKMDSGKITNTASTEYKAFRWLNWLGHILLKRVSFNLGGTEVDKHDGEWYHLWNELTQNAEKAEAYAEMVGNTPNLTHIHTTNKVSSTAFNIFDGTTNSYEFKLRIPLRFWFTKTPGLALPIIALNHSDLSVEIDFRELDDCMWATHESSTNFRAAVGSNIFASGVYPSFSETYIYADYIYLDTDERKRFAQSAHEYLIEKVQIGSTTTKSNSDSINYTMNFTHPVKELIWVIKQADFTSKNFTQSRAGHQYFNYTTEFDYTGFTGTPEPYTGTGMAGGRRAQNLWHGLSGVTLPYYENEFEPDMSESYTTSSAWYGDSGDNSFNSSITTTNAARLRMGYDRVKAYHVDTASDSNGTNDAYTNKTLDRFIGSTSSIQSNGYTTQLASNLTIPSPYLGNWGPSGNNTRLLDQGKNPVLSAKIVLNGTDRISDRDGFYFNVQQPYDYHTTCPAPGINCYSFAFEPEEHQPSGSCNFSRIDNASIEVTLDNSIRTNRTSNMKVYAVSYNILRIMSGLGQLAYAN
jgi:hypothetical protein